MDQPDLRGPEPRYAVLVRPAPALLRDRTAPNVEVVKKPWSLGKSQMAFWWILVSSAFLLTWAVKGQTTGIPESILGLVGIASGTALARP